MTLSMIALFIVFSITHISHAYTFHSQSHYRGINSVTQCIGVARYMTESSHNDALIPNNVKQDEDLTTINNLLLNTDYGRNINKTSEEFINNWIYVKKTDDNLASKNLYGNYNVVYASQGKNQKERGNPAGGNYRGLSSFIYKIDGLYQHILPPRIGDSSAPIVINYIRGILLNCLVLSVILEGICIKLSDKERQELMAKYGNNLSSSTVKAQFQPPLLGISFFSRTLFTVSVGPKSSVDLDVPYLDETLRTGLGARGSTFIFKKTNDIKSFEYKKILDSKIKINAKSVSIVSLLVGIFSLLTKRITLSVSSLLIAATLFFSKGGIIE